MQSYTPAVANTVFVDMVAKLDGEPIVAGSVNLYLIAMSGANAGKWFKSLDSTWSAVEVVSGTATHQADGHWTGSILAAAWTTGLSYCLYGKETTDLHIPVAEEVVEISTPKNVTIIEVTDA